MWECCDGRADRQTLYQFAAELPFAERDCIRIKHDQIIKHDQMSVIHTLNVYILVISRLVKNREKTRGCCGVKAKKLTKVVSGIYFRGAMLRGGDRKA